MRSFTNANGKFSAFRTLEFGFLICGVMLLVVVPKVCGSHHVEIRDEERQPEGEGEWNLLTESSERVSGSNNTVSNSGDGLISSLGGMESSLGSPPLPASENPESSVGIPPDESGLAPESSEPSDYQSRTVTQTASHSESSITAHMTESPIISHTESPLPVPSFHVRFTILGLSRNTFTADVQLEMRTLVAQAAGVTTDDVEIVSVTQQDGFLGRKFRAMESVRGMRGAEVTLYVIARIAHVRPEAAQRVMEKIWRDVHTIGGYEVRAAVVVVPSPEPPTSPTPTVTETKSKTKTLTIVPRTPAVPLPPTAPGQVDLHIVVVVAANQFSAAEQEMFIAELARVLGVSPSQIQVIRIDVVDLDDHSGKRLRTTNARRHVIINDAPSGQTREAISIEARVSGLPPSQTAENTGEIVRTAVSNNNGHLGNFTIASVQARNSDNHLPNAARKPIVLQSNIPLWVGVVVSVASLFVLF